MRNIEKALELASDVLTLSRNTLLVNLRFLDAALSRFKHQPIEHNSMMTDGQYILYDPIFVLRCYKAARELPTRMYLHMLLHCVFRHMYAGPSLDRAYWNLACDIAVEHIIGELDLKSCYVEREKEQQPFFTAIKAELKYVTAEKIYQYLRANAPDPERFADIQKLFLSDNHDIWYMSDTEKAEAYGLSIDSRGGRRDDNDTAGGTDVGVSASAIADDWQRIAERMQVDMETFGNTHGTTPGSLLQNLQAVNREKYDYSAFLRKFAVRGEAMKINDDEFDYVYYTYGLQLYEKMPLVEPLEYKEIKAIRDFVIAIDTSGSTSGELVQTFVQKTYNILKSTESFHTKINLHIIQCDAEIQEDVKITSQQEFDEYLKNMKIHGLGGTDFRPVFKYVDKLRHDGEFSNLRGLIYFTDGYGDFPVRMPEYDTAFVFVDDEYNNPDVPPWAIKLVLQRDEI